MLTEELQLKLPNRCGVAFGFPNFLVAIFEGNSEVWAMSTDSIPILSIEVISDLRLDFNNVASPSEKLKFTSNTGFMLAVIEPTVVLLLLCAELVGFADIVHFR